MIVARAKVSGFRLVKLPWWERVWRWLRRADGVAYDVEVDVDVVTKYEHHVNSEEWR